MSTRLPLHYLGLLVFHFLNAVLPAPTFAADLTATATKFNELLATPTQIAALRKGGYTLYLRHGYTDNAKPDRIPNIDLNDCNTQRPLTEEGRKLAVKVGEHVRAGKIPLGEVFISPLCRVKETAAAAFPKLSAQIDPHLMYVANLTTEQKAPIIARTRELLSTPVAPGENRLLIAHAPNLMELIGYFPKEATLVIFRPLGNKNGFEYVASIPPEHWQQLIR